MKTLAKKQFTPSALEADLDGVYPLSEQQISKFRGDGYVKLKNVLSPATLAYYGREITDQVFRLNNQTKPMSERTTYEKAFLQIMNIWTHSEVVKEFVIGKKLGRLAAELMGVNGVRIYHDQALYKEPGAGFTPWHADQYYWPLSSANTVTAWIPLQAVPLEMGPMQFSATSHKFKMGRDLEISDESEQKISKELLDRKLPLDSNPFDLGEVSFHYGWTFHRAGPNTTADPRKVMTIIYIEDGIRVVKPASKAQQNDLQQWLPECQVGDEAASPLNPVVYRASSAD
jgi:ectoine hydroxylase-related dioxygenase (phytanoyl-CoA dioxygenase family)